MMFRVVVGYEGKLGEKVWLQRVRGVKGSRIRVKCFGRPHPWCVRADCPDPTGEDSMDLGFDDGIDDDKVVFEWKAVGG